MPYKTGWYVEKRIILTSYTGIINVEDIHGQIDETHALIEQGIPLVHSIIDLSQIEKWPPLNVVNEFRAMNIESVRERMGWSIIVANNVVLKFGSALFAPIFNLRQRIFSTLGEGLIFLQENDGTLPDFPK
ncbi:MAG: hypothetical protein H0X30_16135 [Anaerolineae bacterium]|nr:hypothetical protein [Anaerolineae bacterium]